jgi:G3E family GTPase
VAQTFSFRDAEGNSLEDWARLDTLVTVVDASSFQSLYERATMLSALKLTEASDERTVPDLLIDQIEFANVLLVNKADLVSPEDLASLEALLHRLNSGAKLLRATHGATALGEILNTGLFDMEAASSSAGWIRELNAEHTPETEEYGISSFVFRARRPFNPERFWAFLHVHWPGLLRSKGYFWLATRHDAVGLWSQAGGSAEYRPFGYWWASVPKNQWPDDPAATRKIVENWQKPYGDRRQELVFIGQDMSPMLMRESLEACLLTEEELAAGPEHWIDLFSDPFPSWTEDEAATLEV